MRRLAPGWYKEYHASLPDKITARRWLAPTGRRNTLNHQTITLRRFLVPTGTRLVILGNYMYSTVYKKEPGKGCFIISDQTAKKPKSHYWRFNIKTMKTHCLLLSGLDKMTMRIHRPNISGQSKGQWEHIVASVYVRFKQDRARLIEVLTHNTVLGLTVSRQTIN